MAITEAEAKTKTCHVTMGDSFAQKCIGSACMAWRWTNGTEPPDKYTPDVGFGEPSTHGVCGLAGRP